MNGTHKRKAGNNSDESKRNPNVPKDILYTVEEVPPFGLCILLGFQVSLNCMNFHCSCPHYTGKCTNVNVSLIGCRGQYTVSICCSILTEYGKNTLYRDIYTEIVLKNCFLKFMIFEELHGNRNN